MSKPTSTASDAAGLLLASMNGDDDLVNQVIRDTAAYGTREVSALLNWCLFAATQALRADLTDVAERGDTSSPAASYLTALAGHAHRADR